MAGIASSAMPAIALTQSGREAAGCVYLQAASSYTPKTAADFPSLRRMTGNAELSLAAISIELNILLEITTVSAFFDDSESGPGGNAAATLRDPFPSIVGLPDPEGAVLFGNKCYAGLAGNAAAVAAIFAHESAHVLQNRYIGEQLYNISNKDRSVVRTELHADFVSGYYAAYRRRNQQDWESSMHAITQFKFGDCEYANPLHHGTPRERAAAVKAGLDFGDIGSVSPQELALTGLKYVQSLVLDMTTKSTSCSSNL